MTTKRTVFKDGNFRWLWAGQTISVLGDQFSGLALSVLAVTSLGATEWQMGILNASSTASFLLVGLVAGAWVDRWVKRSVMLIADAIRSLTLITIPVFWWFHMLTIQQLFVVSAIMGLAAVFFDVASQSLVPLLFKDDQIGAANGAMETSTQVSHVGGPSLAGILLGVLQAPFLVLFDAFSYAFSSLTLLRVKSHEVPTPKTNRQPLRTEIGEGLRFVYNQKIIRTIATCTSGTNFFSSMIFTLMPLFVLRTLGIPAAAFGVMMSVGAIGGLLGAAFTARLIKFMGEGPLIVLSAVISGLAMCLIPAAGAIPREFAIPLLVVTEFLFSFSVLTYNITQVTARQRLCPPQLLGRMNASIRFFVWGVMPLGGLLAGYLGSTFGALPTMWIGGAGSLLASGLVLFSPLRTLREIPSHAE
jgi:MFS family permease